MKWDGPGLVGRGTVQFLGQTWHYLDFRDKKPFGAERAARFGVDPGDLEERQCLCLGIGGGLAWLEARAEPTMEDAMERGTALLDELTEGALRAQAALGDPPPWMPVL